MPKKWKPWGVFGVVAAATLATALLCAGPWDTARGDVGGYSAYAVEFWQGDPRFAILPQEYPPLAELPFSLTLVPVGAPLAGFIAGSALFFLAGYACFARFAAPGAAGRYALYLLLGAQATLLDRFDLFPMLLTVAALWCAERKRFGWAYVCLALGAGLKVYPLTLMPILAIAQYLDRRREGHSPVSAAGRALGLACAGLAGGLATLFVPARLFGGASLWVAYAVARPVQVESVAGTITWLGTLAGVPAQVENSFGSQSFAGPLATALPAPTVALLVAGCAWICWRQVRGTMDTAMTMLTTLCLLLVTGKVLSTQYLIWVLPVAAAVGGGELWWIAVAALTTLDYPLLFPYSHGLLPLSDVRVWPFLLAVALRNTLLVGITLKLIAGQWRNGRASAPEPAVATPAEVIRTITPTPSSAGRRLAQDAQ